VFYSSPRPSAYLSALCGEITVNAAQQSRSQSFSSPRPSACLSALCGEIIVNAETAEIRRGPQRKPSQEKKNLRTCYAETTETRRDRRRKKLVARAPRSDWFEHGHDRFEHGSRADARVQICVYAKLARTLPDNRERACESGSY
jgi:hypothetical protein